MSLSTAGSSDEITSRKWNNSLNLLILLRKEAGGIASICVTLSQEQTDSSHVWLAETPLFLPLMLSSPPPLAWPKTEYSDTLSVS